MRIASIIIVLAAVGLLITVGCRSGSKPETISPGEKAFRQYCQTCHSLPKPNSMTDEEWPAIVERYGAKAKLDRHTREKILRYLQSNN